MFWDSIFAGLKVLVYWETYVAGLAYLAIYTIPIMAATAAADRKMYTTGRVTNGCFVVVLTPLLQMTATLVFVLILTPIILGLSEDAAWDFPWVLLIVDPGTFFKLVGILLVSIVLLMLIPFMASQALSTFILGGTILIFALRILGFVDPDVANKLTDFIPDFWFSIGLIITAGITYWAGIVVTMGIANGIRLLINPRADEDSIMPFILPIGIVFQFIPVFIYGAWLGLQAKNGTFGIS